MNTVHEDFLSDTKSTPVKVNLPERLVEQLNKFCDSTRQSKSEVIRDYLINGLNSDTRWLNRRFFFKNRVIDSTEQIKNFLKNPPVNTLIKVAANNADNPSSAYLLLGYLIKVEGEKLTIYFPSFPIQHHGLNNSLFEIRNISTTESSLIIPDVENTINAWNMFETKFHYTLPIDYVWGIYDC